MAANNGNFIFIGGTGRSGTTILSKVLNSHSALNRLPFEFRFHIDPHGLYDLYKNLTEDWDVYRGSTAAIEFENFFNKLLGFSFYSYHKITLNSNNKSYYKRIFDDFFKGLNIMEERRLWIGNSPFIPKTLSLLNVRLAKPIYPKFYLTHYLNKNEFYTKAEVFFKKLFDRELKNYQYLIEHTPYNFLFFDFLEKAFSRSKFIHIKRNPLDIISSYSVQNWGSKDFARNSLQIIGLYNRWLAKKKTLNNFLEISLEDLATNPITTLDKISAYLEVDANNFSIDSINANKLHLNRWRENKAYIESLPVFNELRECAVKLGYEI